MLLLALALQAATPAAAPPERISVLVPIPGQPCVDRGPAGDDILVCAQNLPSQALPVPREATSPLPQPVNRDMNGVGALAAEATPCAARVGGCQVGVDVMGMGTALIRGVQKLVAPNSCCEEPGEATSAGKLLVDVGGGIARLVKRKPDKSARVAIPLDEPELAGRVLP